MKLGLVTKFDKKNMKTPKKTFDQVILTNCEVITIFLINGYFGTLPFHK